MTREEFKEEWDRHLSRLKIVTRGYSPGATEELELSEIFWGMKKNESVEEMNEYLLGIEYRMLTPQGHNLN